VQGVAVTRGPRQRQGLVTQPPSLPVVRGGVQFRRLGGEQARAIACPGRHLGGPTKHGQALEVDTRAGTPDLPDSRECGPHEQLGVTEMIGEAGRGDPGRPVGRVPDQVLGLRQPDEHLALVSQRAASPAHVSQCPAEAGHRVGRVPCPQRLLAFGERIGQCCVCPRRRGWASGRPDNVPPLDCGVLRQHGRLQPAQPRARLDAQLGDEDVTRTLVRTERLRLPARAVEGAHQQLPAPFPQRLVGDARLDLGYRAQMLALPEPGVETVFDHGSPQVGESRDRTLGWRPVGQIEVRITGPEAQRLVEGVDCRRAGRMPLLPPGDGERLEDTGVDLFWRDRQDVATRSGLDRRCAHRVAEGEHMVLHDLAGSRWDTLAPQRIREPVDIDALAHLQRQCRESAAPQPRGRGRPPARTAYRKRPEHPASGS
jgi:hypothetical protein